MLDIIIVAIYLIAVLLAGIKSGLKIKTLRDYSVGYKTFPTMVVTAAVFATLVGGGDLVGVSEKVFSSGLVVIFGFLGFIARDLLTAWFIIPRFTDYHDCLTAGDVMGKFYGKSGKILVGVAGVLQNAIFLGVQVGALGYVTEYFFGVPQWIGMVISALVVVLYSSIGGIYSVTITDVMQFGVLVAAMPILFSIGVERVGGLSGILQAIPAEKLSIIPRNGDDIRFYSLFFVFAIPYLGPVLLQRMLMSRDFRQARSAFMISATLRFPFYFMIGTLGFVALILKPDLQSNFAFPYLVNTILPVGVKGFVVAGVLAVIMSTADSVLHVSGIMFVHDIISPIFGEKITKNRELILSQVFTALIGLLSIVAALTIKSLIEISVLGFACWLPVISVPLIAGILGIRASKRALFISGFFGLLAFFVWRFNFFAVTHIDSVLPGFVMSAIVFFLVHGIEVKLLKRKSLVPRFSKA